MDNQTIQNAGFGKRVFAALLDSLISLLILIGPVTLLLEGTNNSVKDPSDLISSVMPALTYVLTMVFLSGMLQIAYHVYFVSKFGGTLGKLLAGIKIVDNDTNELITKKQAFYRVILGYMFSAQIFGLGFLSILKDPKNRAWHDKLFNTKVVKKGSMALGIVVFVALLIGIPFLFGLSFSQVINLTQGIYDKGIVPESTPSKYNPYKIIL